MNKEEQLIRDIDILEDVTDGLFKRVSDDVDSIMKIARKLELEETAIMMLNDSIGEIKIKGIKNEIQ